MTKKVASGENPLVLVVDDFEDNRAMYVEYLQFQGFRVVEAVNGAEAVERTVDLLPLVVVMDLSLPVMDGWEATRRIKADERTKHIRVIALTGHAEPAHAKKALDAGCDDFVAKPCLPENLLAKIREHLPAGKTAAPRLKDIATTRAEKTGPASRDNKQSKGKK
ncbi:MAG TPA: response regulator [Labilithrix sp.]|nr:response regulator [Labilithrix sp.]